MSKSTLVHRMALCFDFAIMLHKKVRGKNINVVQPFCAEDSNNTEKN